MSAFGYTLAMRVMQSELYGKLSAQARAECDELISRGFQAERDQAGRVPDPNAEQWEAIASLRPIRIFARMVFDLGIQLETDP